MKIPFYDINFRVHKKSKSKINLQTKTVTTEENKEENKRIITCMLLNSYNLKFKFAQKRYENVVKSKKHFYGF